MPAKKTRSLRMPGAMLAGLLLIAPAPPAAANYEQACEVPRIEDSFAVLDPDADTIAEIQARLIDTNFLTWRPDGEFDAETRDALHEFCLRIGPDHDDIPLTDPANPTADLAKFLLEKLADIGRVRGGDEKNTGVDEEDAAPADAGDAKAGAPGSESPGQRGSGGAEKSASARTSSSQGGAAGNQGEPTGDDAAGGEQDPPSPCSISSVMKIFGQQQNRPEENIRQIQMLLKAGGFLGDRVDGWRGPETYRALAELCQYMVESKKRHDDKTGEDADLANALLRQLSTGDLESIRTDLQRWPLEIELSAIEDCGCSREFEAQVYGFLPRWLADGEARTVDFSVLDRIGIHALRLEGDGKLQANSPWGARSERQIGRFIGAARRHRVRVDLTFYLADWMRWGKDEIANAAAAIEDAARAEFKFEPVDPLERLERDLRRLLPFVDSKSTVQADGVNLYFDRYESAADAGTLIRLVEAVARALPDKQLNVLLGLSWAGIGRIDGADATAELRGLDRTMFAELRPIIVAVPAPKTGDEADPARLPIDNLFVFLPRPNALPRGTSLSKKLLRRAIEDAFDGDGMARRALLRKTIPIIATSADAVPENYFEPNGPFVDDLIYLQDNFAGVGLWPLPLMPPEDGAAINDGAAIGERLKETYLVDYVPVGQAEGGVSLAEEICTYACPNRWLFRLVFDLLVAGLVLFGLLAMWFCRLREFYQRRFLYFFTYGVATAGVFAVSLACDPFWSERRDFVLAGTVMAVVGFILMRYIRRSLQPRRP